VGVAMFALYRPHGSLAAGVVVIAAGVYEVTALKRHFRRLCRGNVRSGFWFGLDCGGSSRLYSIENKGPAGCDAIQTTHGAFLSGSCFADKKWVAAPVNRYEARFVWDMRLNSRPARSTPTTMPAPSRVKKPRCPLR